MSDRIGTRPLMAAGLALQAAGLVWLAVVSAPDVPYGVLVPGFVMAGSGMALVFAPAVNAVLGAVRPEEAGQASGAPTRSARSAACSEWRCWPPCSPAPAATPRRRSSWQPADADTPLAQPAAA